MLNLIAPNEIGFAVGLAANPHPEEDGFSAGPPTHYAFNHEAATQELVNQIDALKVGGIDDLLPDVQWGTGGLPTKEQAIAAIAAAGFFQRMDEQTTILEHFEQNCGKNSQLGLMKVLG